MQARVKLGLALLAAVFSGSAVAVLPAATGQEMNAAPVDVAKTPGPPAPSVATPYPNTVHGMGAPDSQKEGSKTPVQGEAVLKNKSSLTHSTGDEAGSSTGTGLATRSTGAPEYKNYSFDVKQEGENVNRNLAPTLSNRQPKPVVKEPRPVNVVTPKPSRPVILAPIDVVKRPLPTPRPVAVPQPLPQPVKTQPVLLQQPRVQVPVRR